MTLINLKFSPEMEKAVMEGRKCCTTRDEPKGKIGDVFRVKGRLYRVIQITMCDFLNVLPLANAEGFSSDIKFEIEIRKYYPDITYDNKVFIHFFAYIGDWCPQFGISGAACSDPETLCTIYEECKRSI
jgi:hypothetical protein